MNRESFWIRCLTIFSMVLLLLAWQKMLLRFVQSQLHCTWDILIMLQGLHKAVAVEVDLEQGGESVMMRMILPSEEGASGWQ